MSYSRSTIPVRRHESVESIHPGKSVIQTNTPRFKKHPTYKDSGVEWLGKIPEHWHITRFKYIAETNKGKLPNKIVSNKEADLPPYMSMEYLRGGIENQWVSDKDPVIIDSNEILLLWDGSNSGEFLRSRKGVISSTVAHIIFKKININYAWYQSKVLEVQLRKNTIGMGIPHVNGKFLNNAQILIPPLPEQTAIAEFLDDKTRKIDQAIGIKERQISLLNERKQILIQDLVTGKKVWNTEKKAWTDPAEVKDSGVEWIGKIPAGWEVTEIRKLCSTTSGGTPPSGERKLYYDGCIPWIRTTDLNNDELFDVPEKITKEAVRDTACKIVPKNTVCVAMYGGPGTIGKHSVIRFTGTLNQALCGIIPSNKVDSEFLYYYVKFYRPHWMFYAKGSRVDPNISQDQVRRMLIPLIPKSDQLHIVKYIKIETSRINRAISLHHSQMEKLVEYKTTLIDRVVKGKININ
ncbi:restriction endonuclease subunit S [Membranicola marinus]|uniref:Restriction endonuclease subunit S n=1 Tax=Membranihabitans marinus TaxID=1227546 RepID=A0A953LCK6_9BACT|nr:restriction endonuclease subunit S [Membranihabitans marinus]MBY5959606.1 restriction endonuclease subunit S [Membranihabitans marinus]